MPRPTAADVSAAMPAHLYTAGLRRYISAYAAVTYSFLFRTVARSPGFPGVNSIRRLARDLPLRARVALRMNGGWYERYSHHSSAPSSCP